MGRHKNNGSCDHCDWIINRYPHFYAPLRTWFWTFQKKHPEAHISCAGRGRVEQESLYLRRASRARYGESAHNYNVALDIFEMGGSEIRNIYEREWFFKVLKPNLPDYVIWYGEPGAKFPELPHIEVKNWRELVKNGDIKLVE